MNATNGSSSGGITFAGLLAIVFIVLKLLGKIGWSWWWVLSPVWIPMAVVALIFLGIVVHSFWPCIFRKKRG